MKMNVLYDQGSAPVAEDGIVFHPPYYFGVTDGVSGVYLPDEGPMLFSGLTGGQLASRIISRAFTFAVPNSSLKGVLKEANDMLWDISREHKLFLQESELLPSASFIVGKIGKFDIKIIQGGDCLAIWQTKDGTLGGTPNKAYTFGEELLRTIAELMEKHKGNRKKMWGDFRPILIKERRANINTKQGGFALLNGQMGFQNFWQEFTLPLGNISLLVLFSDGFVPFKWTQQELGMAGEMIRLYGKEGLSSILEATRLIAEQEKSSSHEDFAEATAIAIEF